MLEILIIIAVVKVFSATAVDKARSKFLWGAIGALSYYVPLLLMSFFLLPLLVNSGVLPFVTRENYFVVGIVFNLITGVACCMIAFLILKNLPNANERSKGKNYSGGGSSIDLDDDNPYRANY